MYVVVCYWPTGNHIVGQLYNTHERRNSICFQKYINQSIPVDRSSQHVNVPPNVSRHSWTRLLKTVPFVIGLDSYVKDSGHMLNILDSFRFRDEHPFIFTMDIKSLYTVISNGEGLHALIYFLDKRKVLDPPTHTHTTLYG